MSNRDILVSKSEVLQLVNNIMTKHADQADKMVEEFFKSKQQLETPGGSHGPIQKCDSKCFSCMLCVAA